ncbi:MAG: DUF2220 family protein [Gammaproteobacteria bacterium]|nr:DUF2220 family protein [Gammaproteobacteria bacterium]
MHRPAWLDEEAEILGLLSSLIDDLDKRPYSQRKQALRKKLNKKTLPGLFRHDAGSDQLWSLLKSLSTDYHIFDIKVDHKRGPYAAEFDNAALLFLENAEPLVRRWLLRPARRPYRQEWSDAVYSNESCFGDALDEFANRPIQVTGLSAEDIVLGFVKLSSLISKGMSLRQLSAYCFFGDSKFLDQRQDYVEKLFANSNIRPRPVVVNAYLPPRFDDVLFVENQDSYTELVLRGGMKFAIVYMAGFRSSARNIRDRDSVSLHFHHASTESEKDAFQSWWFQESSQLRDVWFWGDLDFSGMGILKSLRQRFNNAAAWRPGYQALLRALESGAGHKAETASKEEQQDPGEIGCEYADQELLPALRIRKRFIDQEGVLLDAI